MDGIAALDLDVAWRRLCQDRPERVFVCHPFLFEVIESDLPAWLAGVKARLVGGYTPSPAVTCYAPKGDHMVRPGAVLALEDELVFNAALGAVHEHVWKRIGGAQGKTDLAYQLASPSKTPLWVKRGFLVWTEWRRQSLRLLDDGVFYVLTADLAAFYENIDLHRVASDLKSINAPEPVISLLMQLLHKWAYPRGKGIPQGFSGSDILAKLYLDAVDRGMANAGYTHLRYVDDFRVFCRTLHEAKRALHLLNDLVRARGLNLQSGKTKILTAQEARQAIDGVSPLIESIALVLKQELQAMGGGDVHYGTLGDLDRVLGRNPAAPPPEILDRAFAEHFLSSDRFDKSLFHYLLTRLGRVKSKVAVEYCLRLLAVRPEETEYILRYLGNFEVGGDVLRQVLDVLDSPDSVYDHQLYQIVRWFYVRDQVVERLLFICRRWASDRNRASWLRAYCMAIMGASSDPGDLEHIENMYQYAGTEVEQVEIILSLQRMETGRRNAMLGRVKGESLLVGMAVEYVRRGGIFKRKQPDPSAEEHNDPEL